MSHAPGIELVMDVCTSSCGHQELRWGQAWFSVFKLLNWQTVRRESREELDHVATSKNGVSNAKRACAKRIIRSKQHDAIGHWVRRIYQRTLALAASQDEPQRQRTSRA